LAREWGNGPTIQLHQQSYDLHKQLASSLDITSYREVITLNVDGNVNSRSRNSGSSSGSNSDNVASWLDRKVVSNVMDTATAQVTPKEFVDKLLSSAKSTGLVDVIIDTVVGVIMKNDIPGSYDNVDGKGECSESGRGRSSSSSSSSSSDGSSSRIVGVTTLHNGVIEGDALVICLGPWSGIMPIIITII